jgi:hypothetical protein
LNDELDFCRVYKSAQNEYPLVVYARNADVAVIAHRMLSVTIHRKAVESGAGAPTTHMKTPIAPTDNTVSQAKKTDSLNVISSPELFDVLDIVSVVESVD